MKTNTHGGKRQGAGRKPLPKSEKKRSVTLKLHPKFIRALQRIARRKHFSQAETVEYLLTIHVTLEMLCNPADL